MLDDMKSAVDVMEKAKSYMARAIGHEFAKTYDVPLAKPTTIFVNDETVMNAACATQAPEKIVHPLILKRRSLMLVL